MLFREHPELLAKFRAGDRAALEQVYRRYVDDLLALARHGFVLRGPPPLQIRGMADPSERMDLVQETFTKAFQPRARAGYDGVRPYRAYLLTVARNLWIDRARRSGRERVVSGDPEDGPTLEDLMEREGPLPTPGEVGPETDLDTRRQMAATAHYVAGLEPLAQRYVKLRFEQEQPQLHVAEALGISRRQARTLESQIQQGLVRHLRSRTSGHGTDHDRKGE